MQAWAEQRGLPVPSENTGAYCQARADLPVAMLRAVNDSLLGQLDADLSESGHWWGLLPRAEDGTSAQMPDTPTNREKYPYPHNQKKGCGFPVVKQRTRYIAIALLDPIAYPVDEVASLYLHRWEIEVRFRDIKTTLGMEMLHTKFPPMIEKELLMHQIVYNLMRLIMLKAATEHGVNHRRLSFRGVQQVVLAFIDNFRDMANRSILRMQQRAKMWLRVAERVVLERPGRNEPRRVNRRPKFTHWIQKPRHEYFEHFQAENPPMIILDNLA